MPEPLIMVIKLPMVLQHPLTWIILQCLTTVFLEIDMSKECLDDVEIYVVGYARQISISVKTGFA